MFVNLRSVSPCSNSPSSPLLVAIGGYTLRRSSVGKSIREKSPLVLMALPDDSDVIASLASCRTLSGSLDMVWVSMSCESERDCIHLSITRMWEAVTLHAVFLPFNVAMQIDFVSQYAVRKLVQKKTVADSTPTKKRVFAIIVGIMPGLMSFQTSPDFL
jgi:hypothetical protein